MSIGTAHNGGPLDTLRLSDAQSRQLLQRLEAVSRQVVVDRNSRRSERVAFEHGAKSVVQVFQATGTPISFKVYLRNLSETGIGFLHGGFIHPGSPCRVLLRRSDGTAVGVTGRIARCGHSAGRVHEVGVHFDEPLDLGEYIAGYGDGLLSPLWEDPEMRPMLLRFLEQLGDTVRQVRRAARAEQGDWRQVRELCERLGASARSFGYGPISDAARAVIDAIVGAEPLEPAAAVIELTSLADGARRAVGIQ